VLIANNFCFTILLCISSILSPISDLQTTNKPTATELKVTQGSGYVNVFIKSEKPSKILILTPSGEKKWHKTEPKENISNTKIWLTWGCGKYIVSIMENQLDNTYRYISSKVIINNTYIEPYMLPSSDIESDYPEIISLSKSIISDANTDSEKSFRLYNWITSNIIYDYQKYDQMQKNDHKLKFGALETLKTRKGVCYDYSTLYASLGRAAGLKVKVVSGNLKSDKKYTYHTWNEVYLRESKEWISIDSSMAFVQKRLYFANLDIKKYYFKTEED
jgi:hypothetical protein